MPDHAGRCAPDGAGLALALSEERFGAGAVAGGKGLARFAPGNLGPAQGDPRIEFVDRIGVNGLTAQFLGSIGTQPGKALVGFHGSLVLTRTG